MLGGGILRAARAKIVLVAVFLGPSMMIALQMSGKSFRHYYDLDTDYGLTLTIVALVVLCFKFALVDGLARYTLYRKESVFSSLPNVPGPRNWAVWVVATIYIMELANYSNLALEGGVSLIDLLSWEFQVDVLALGIVSTIMVFLLLRKRSIMEKLVYSIVGTVTLLLLYCVVVSLAGPGDVVDRIFIADLPVDVLYLAGSGSGLSLLLYSIWLSDKAKNVSSGDDYRTEYSKVRSSLGLSFFLTGVITALILIITPISPDDSATIVSTLLLLCMTILMFGVVMVGMDGRARAIGKMLRQTGVSKQQREVTYRVLILFFFVLITIALFFGTPFGVLRLVSAVSSAMFAMAGFALIYIDRKLPAYAKGGRIWVVFTFIGSSFLLMVALLEEKTLLNFGLPLMIRVGVIGILLYLMWRSNVLDWLIRNSRQFRGTLAIVAIFSTVAIFGTVAGISYEGLIINFRDLGAIMAGLLGGPVAGTLVGVIGGAYRYSLGGWTALPCFAATIFAGLFSGLMIERWKGRISYLKVTVLGLLIECVHIFLFLPLLQQGGTAEMLEETMRDIFLPMAITNILGLNIYAFIIEKWKGSDADRG